MLVSGAVENRYRLIYLELHGYGLKKRGQRGCLLLGRLEVFKLQHPKIVLAHKPFTPFHKTLLQLSTEVRVCGHIWLELKQNERVQNTSTALACIHSRLKFLTHGGEARQKFGPSYRRFHTLLCHVLRVDQVHQFYRCLVRPSVDSL